MSRIGVLRRTDKLDLDILDYYYAAGAMIKTFRGEAYETLINQTGGGREAKRSQRTWDTTTNDWKA